MPQTRREGTAVSVIQAAVSGKATASAATGLIAAASPVAPPASANARHVGRSAARIESRKPRASKKTAGTSGVRKWDART